MGCMKSKQTFPFPTTFENEKQHESEEAFIPEERLLPKMPSSGTTQKAGKVIPPPSTVILKYAESLAQEIVKDALNQWASNNTKYCDIPYIENDSSDTAG
ncbi:small membrane A-kinase anchor protein [Perognathus longimembris pacificus]|uniref:small membrane A-kinase anchor protein n=1 Tax=Perognathus longimembris pacificus TaxID=214514 RepID=UPI0020184693|nr:small membrane A-kinase anchor protein [Perognathus longimembris pacificus]